MNKIYSLFVLFMLLISASSTSYCGEPENSTTVKHIVLMWLHEPGNQQAIDEIRGVSYNFKNIPGVLSVHVGRAIQSERPIVDDSFDVGITITFPNQEAMNRYLTHPIHKNTVRDIIKPLVKRILVYDIQE